MAVSAEHGQESGLAISIVTAFLAVQCPQCRVGFISASKEPAKLLKCVFWVLKVPCHNFEL